MAQNSITVTEKRENWFVRLQKRWGVSASKAVIILIVFALTGFSVMFLKKPIVNFFVPDGSKSLLFSILYYILILPVYNIILLIWGFVLGQFSFFWEFEERFFNRIFRRGASSKS